MIESRVIDSNNVGAFCPFVNARTCNRTGISPLRGSDGQTVVNDKEKANVLNSFFSGLYVLLIMGLNHRFLQLLLVVLLDQSALLSSTLAMC